MVCSALGGVVAAACWAGSVLAQQPTQGARLSSAADQRLAIMHKADEALLADRSGDAKVRSLRPERSTRSAATGQVSEEIAVAASIAIEADARYLAWLGIAGNKPILRLQDDGQAAMGMRSVGGSPVPGQRLAEVVQIKDKLDEYGFCSGVLMLDRVTVVTAAHCLCRSTSQLAVVFGNDLTNPSTHTVHVVAGKKSYDGVVCKDGAPVIASLVGRDLAVLRLEREVPTGTARPLWSDAVGDGSFLRQHFEAKPENRQLLVVGYGFLDSDRRANEKNNVVVPILSPDCAPSATHDASVWGCVEGKEILSQDPNTPAGSTRQRQKIERAGPCNGDSGGAAYALIPRADGKYDRRIVGIVSRSANRPPALHDCGDGGIYTLLTTEAMAWIRKTQAELGSQYKGTPNP